MTPADQPSGRSDGGVENPADARLAKGQQFTAFEADRGWMVGIGPVSDFFGIARVASEDVANWLLALLAARGAK